MKDPGLSHLNRIPQKKLDLILERVSKLEERERNLYTRLFVLYTNANIPIEYWDLNPENFVGKSGSKKIFEDYVADIGKSYLDGRSFLISGNHGSGKTWLLTNLLKFASRNGYRCLYTSMADIVSLLTSGPVEQKYLARQELFMSDFLSVDEFDDRFILSGASADLFLSTLENILRPRLANKLPTFISTNSTNILEAFKGTLKESLMSLFKKIEKHSIFDNDLRSTTCLPNPKPLKSTMNT